MRKEVVPGIVGKVLVLALLVPVFLAPPREAAARALADSKDVQQAGKVLRLNREAMEMFEQLEFDLARQSLLEAVELGESAGLGDHAVMVRTHANLGMVLGVGLKDQDKAVVHFKRVLELKPDYKLPKDIATPEASALFARAGKELKAANRSERTSDETAKEAMALLEKTPAASASDNERAKGAIRSGGAGASGGALKCPTAGEVDAGDDVTLRCVTSAELSPASVILFYKPSGAGDFTAVPMKVSTGARGTWSGRIPGRAVGGTWLPFYFEARDRSGERLALAGRDDSPNILTIKGGSDDAGEAEAEITTRASTRKSRRPQQQEDEENPLEDGKPQGKAAWRQKIWLGLGIGSGGGYARGKGVEAYRAYVRGFTPGLAPEGLAHASPEIGYFLSPGVALSLQGRHQYIPRPNKITAGGANAVLARLLFFAGDGDGRFYGSLAAGGGEGFRLVVKADTTDGKAVQDTVRGGPILAGAGGGYAYALGDSIIWMIETNVLTGFPDFSAAVDFNTGFRFGF